MSTTTFLVTCPCGSGEAVEARDAGFAATEVDVDLCEACAHPFVSGRTMRKSWAFANVVARHAEVRHVDGLVTFAWVNV